MRNIKRKSWIVRRLMFVMTFSIIFSITGCSSKNNNNPYETIHYSDSTFNYDISENEAVVTGLSPEGRARLSTNTTKEVLYIPETITDKNVPVVKILNKAFKDCDLIEEINISDNVTEILEYAFEGCANLTDVSFGYEGLGTNSKLKTINKGAFSNCPKFFGLRVPNSVTTICEEAFSASGLQSIVLQENLLTMERRLFRDCCNLIRIDIPSSVKTFGEEMFWGCENLESVTFDKNSQIEELNDYTFANCKKLKYINYFPKNIKELGESIFWGCESLQTLTLPEDIKLEIIGKGAFRDCINLESFTIPSTVTTIDNYAFSNCKKIQKIVVPSSVTTIGEMAFENCEKLSQIVFIEPCQIKELPQWVFDGCGFTTLYIPNGIETLGYQALTSCYDLTTIYIPTSVTLLKELSIYNFPELSLIEYAGTKEQWEKISKENKWYDGTSIFQIHCTDGYIIPNSAGNIE